MIRKRQAREGPSYQVTVADAAGAESPSFRSDVQLPVIVIYTAVVY
jgi:hypothetical protein